jgi:hypothetical protein
MTYQNTLKLKHSISIKKIKYLSKENLQPNLILDGHYFIPL